MTYRKQGFVLNPSPQTKFSLFTKQNIYITIATFPFSYKEYNAQNLADFRLVCSIDNAISLLVDWKLPLGLPPLYQPQGQHSHADGQAAYLPESAYVPLQAILYMRTM